MKYVCVVFDRKNNQNVFRLGVGHEQRRLGSRRPRRHLASHPRTRTAPCTSPASAAQLAKVAQGGGQASHAAMRAAFDSVCARFPPAMHHFFLENFRDPGALRYAALCCAVLCCAVLHHFFLEHLRDSGALRCGCGVLIPCCAVLCCDNIRLPL